MNKQGVSFYMSLGLLVLFSAVALSTASFVVQHATVIYHNVNSLETRTTAKLAIDEATKLIEDRKFVDSVFLQNVANRTGVGITVTTNDVLELTYALSATEEYVVYLDTIYLYDELFQYEFRGVGEVEEGVSVDHMLKNYVFYLIEKMYGPITLYPLKVDTFQEVIDYTEQMALAGEWLTYQTAATFITNATPIIESTPNTLPVITQSTFVKGSVTLGGNSNKVLIVPEDMVLIIDGDFTFDTKAELYGTVIVNGDVVISGNSDYLYGTLYVNGNFTGSKKLTFSGLDTTPAFVFSTGTAYLDNNCDGVLYFYGNTIDVKNGYESQITGGIYSETQTSQQLIALFTDTGADSISPNLVMGEDDFEQFGVLALLNKTNEEYTGYDRTTLIQRTK